MRAPRREGPPSQQIAVAVFWACACPPPNWISVAGVPWLKKRLTAIQNALGLRRYIIAATVGAVIGFVDLVYGRLESAGLSAWTGIPPFAIGVAVALAIVVWCFVERMAALEARIRGTRAELAILRSRGVELRNEAQHGFLNNPAWDEWSQKATTWNVEVVSAIRKFSEADAEWFGVLDVVPAPRIGNPLGDGDQIKLYWMHDFRVKRLGKMIYGLWKDTPP